MADTREFTRKVIVPENNPIYSSKNKESSMEKDSGGHARQNKGVENNTEMHRTQKYSTVDYEAVTPPSITISLPVI